MYWNGDERASASRLGWDMVLGECNTMRCGMNYITDSKIWISTIRVPARLSHQVTLRLMEVEGYTPCTTPFCSFPLYGPVVSFTQLSRLCIAREGGKDHPCRTAAEARTADLIMA